MSASANLTTGFIDLATLDDIDRKLYQGEKVTTLFTSKIRVTSWFTQLAVPLKAEGQVSQPNYKISRTGDFLVHSWMRIALPALRFNGLSGTSEYQMKWSKNIGHHIIKQAQIQFNDLTVQTIDSQALDMVSQFRRSAGKRECYDDMVGGNADVWYGQRSARITIGGVTLEATQAGATKILVDSTVTGVADMPARTVIVDLPFFYGRDSGVSLPLVALSMNDMRLVFDLETDLKKFLRVRRRVLGAANQPATAGDWQFLANGGTAHGQAHALIHDVATSTTPTFVLAMPEVWSKYVLVSNNERKFHKAQEREMVIEQVQKISGTAHATGAQSIDFHFSYPVRALLFAAENQRAKNYNNYSCYSTDPIGESARSRDSIRHNSVSENANVDPITLVTLKYENTPRFENMPADHFAKVESLYHAKSCPTEVGHHGLFYCLNFNAVEPDGSTNYSKLTSTLTTTTQAADPLTGTLYTAEADANALNYIVHLRAISMNVVLIKEGSIGFPNF
jgi:hypothetical protein